MHINPPHPKGALACHVEGIPPFDGRFGWATNTPFGEGIEEFFVMWREMLTPVTHEVP